MIAKICLMMAYIIYTLCVMYYDNQIKQDVERIRRMRGRYKRV
jgi:hypothetical protein